jgi:hypothetical protein
LLAERAPGLRDNLARPLDKSIQLMTAPLEEREQIFGRSLHSDLLWGHGWE